jgi:hypothetical protein
VVVVVVAAIIGALLGSLITYAVTEGGGDDPNPAVQSTPSAEPSPELDPVEECQSAARRLQRFLDRAESAYQPANALAPGAPEQRRIQVLRDVAAELFTIEVEARAVDVPAEVDEIHALFLSFIDAANEVYEDAVQLEASGSTTDEQDAAIQTLVAEGNAAREAVIRELERFDAQACRV